MLLLSGCARTEPGTGVSIQFDGTFDTSDGFHMDGEIETSGGVSPKESYRNVVVCLYFNETDQIVRERVGDLQADDQLSVSITSSRIPTYIVINSPDFWHPQNEVDYYERSDGLYTVYTVGREEDLPASDCGL
jgi:hypothetical protein